MIPNPFQAPGREFWNGELKLYEVRVVLWDTRVTKVVATVGKATTGLLLEGLSRWEDYEVLVFANNSAGGTPNSFPLHLERHVVGKCCLYSTRLVLILKWDDWRKSDQT